MIIIYLMRKESINNPRHLTYAQEASEEKNKVGQILLNGTLLILTLRYIDFPFALFFILFLSYLKRNILFPSYFIFFLLLDLKLVTNIIKVPGQLNFGTLLMQNGTSQSLFYCFILLTPILVVLFDFNKKYLIYIFKFIGSKSLLATIAFLTIPALVFNQPFDLNIKALLIILLVLSIQTFFILKNKAIGPYSSFSQKYLEASLFPLTLLIREKEKEKQTKCDNSNSIYFLVLMAILSILSYEFINYFQLIKYLKLSSPWAFQFKSAIHFIFIDQIYILVVGACLNLSCRSRFKKHHLSLNSLINNLFFLQRFLWLKISYPCFKVVSSLYPNMNRNIKKISMPLFCFLLNFSIFYTFCSLTRTYSQEDKGLSIVFISLPFFAMVYFKKAVSYFLK